MIQKTEKIRNLFLDIYSELDYNRTLLTNPEFWLPRLSEVEQAIERNSIIHIKRYGNITQCENKAWYLFSDIHKERSLKVQNMIKEQAITFNDVPTEWQNRWALGWCTGWAKSIFQTKSDSMCWALTSDEGLKIISPETNQIRDVDLKHYSVFLIVG